MFAAPLPLVLYRLKKRATRYFAIISVESSGPSDIRKSPLLCDDEKACVGRHVDSEKSGSLRLGRPRSQAVGQFDSVTEKQRESYSER